jgi:hypothetical protein
MEETSKDKSVDAIDALFVAELYELSSKNEISGHDHLFDILRYFEENIQILSECFEKAAVINTCISSELKNQGGGLSSAVFVDIFVTKFLDMKLLSFHTHHDGESDCIILNTSISLKKICNKNPSIALDWSKNKTKSDKEYFTV